MSEQDALEARFEELTARVEELIALLEEAREEYWLRMLRRALPRVRDRQLVGVTDLLGNYGGADTFSDLVIGERWKEQNHTRWVVQNRKLVHLRTSIFDLANEIASRTARDR